MPFTGGGVKAAPPPPRATVTTRLSQAACGTMRSIAGPSGVITLLAVAVALLSGVLARRGFDYYDETGKRFYGRDQMQETYTYRQLLRRYDDGEILSRSELNKWVRFHKKHREVTERLREERDAGDPGEK
jgi:hypothetical protein